MMFCYDETKKIVGGKINYINNEHSFIFLPQIGTNYLVFNTCTLNFTKTGIITSFDGFCMKEYWKDYLIDLPNNIKKAQLKIIGIDENVSYNTCIGEDFDMCFNSHNGLFFLGDLKKYYNKKQSLYAVNFATDSFAIIDEGCLIGIFLKPYFVS